MIKKITEIISNYFQSFNNEPTGYSRTKLVAYAFSAMTMIVEWVWLIDGEWEYLVEVLIINTSLITALLGVRAFARKKKEEIKQVQHPEQ